MDILIKPGSKPMSRQVLLTTRGEYQELERVDVRIVRSALKIVKEEGYTLEMEMPPLRKKQIF